MKHQYFGDINDFRKYGLLRCIAEVLGEGLGVLWLLTPDDGRTDGEFRRYLQEPKKWRSHDPHLYDSLSKLFDGETARHVGHAAAWELLPNAKYFEKTVPDSAIERAALINEAEHALADCPLIFIDPDNGIEVKSVPYGSKGSHKYVYWRELESFYRRGHSLVVYQHYPRLSRPAYRASLIAQFREHLRATDVTVYSTAHAAFVFALQSRHASSLPRIDDTLKFRWRGQVEIESRE